MERPFRCNGTHKVLPQPSIYDFCSLGRAQLDWMLVRFSKATSYRSSGAGALLYERVCGD